MWSLEPWMNPANDRRTPYTEEELELFAEGFIASMSDTEKLKNMIEKEKFEMKLQSYGFFELSS